MYRAIIQIPYAPFTMLKDSNDSQGMKHLGIDELLSKRRVLRDLARQMLCGWPSQLDMASGQWFSNCSGLGPIVGGCPVSTFDPV